LLQWLVSCSKSEAHRAFYKPTPICIEQCDWDCCPREGTVADIVDGSVVGTGDKTAAGAVAGSVDGSVTRTADGILL